MITQEHISDFILKSNMIFENKKILKEDDDYGGNLDGYPSSGLFAIFAKPLDDIFKAMKLTAMDISNALQLIVKSINNVFDPQKIDEIRSEYELKRSKILTQWKPIIQNSVSSIETADPFVTMAISPYLFMATKTLSTSIAVGKTTAEILSGEEWAGIRSKINRYPDLQTGMKATADASRRNTTAVEKLTSDLHKLFFGKAIKKESLIREKKEQVASEEDIKRFFEESGINRVLNDSLSNLLREKISLYKELLPLISLSSELIKLAKIKDIESFKKEIVKLNIKDDIKKQSLSDLNTFMNQIEQKAKVLSKDSKFKEELLSKLSLSEEKLSEEDLLMYATNVVFEASKLKFDKDNLNRVKQLVKWIKENKNFFVGKEDLKKISENKKNISSADDFIKIYTKLVSLYKNIEKA